MWSKQRKLSYLDCCIDLFFDCVTPHRLFLIQLHVEAKVMVLYYAMCDNI